MSDITFSHNRMRFSVSVLAKALHSKGQKSRFKTKLSKGGKTGSLGTGKFKSSNSSGRGTTRVSRLGSAVEILQGLAKESPPSQHQTGSKNESAVDHRRTVVDEKIAQTISSLRPDADSTPRNAGDFIRLMEAGKLAEKLSPTPSATVGSASVMSTLTKSSSASSSLSDLLKMQKAPMEATSVTQTSTKSQRVKELNQVLSGPTPKTKTEIERAAAVPAALHPFSSLPPLPREAPAAQKNNKAPSERGKYDFLRYLKSGAQDLANSLRAAKQQQPPQQQQQQKQQHRHHQHQHAHKQTQAPQPSNRAAGGFIKADPKKPGELASDSLRWILDSLPHPTSHKHTIPLTLAELQPISSAVQKRWELYGKIREFHSSGRFVELIETMEQEVKEVGGDLRALVADTAILDLILDAYFSSQRYGDVVQLFNSLRVSGHPHSSHHDPAHPRVAISVTGYCIAIESVLKFMPKDAGVSVAIAMYSECLKQYEPTPQLVMAFFRGCDVLDPESATLQQFALEEFRRIAPSHQFSTADVKSVVEAALNGMCAKLGRTDLNTEDVFQAVSPILSAAHSDAYKKTLVAVLPAIVRKLDVSSIDLLEKMRKSYSFFHPSSDLIDACVEAELNRLRHDPLHLYNSLLLKLRHPRSSQASTYLRWVRNDCAQRLAISLAETGSFKEARATLVHLLDSHQHVTLKTYYAVLSTYLQNEDISGASLVAASLRSAYANPDPSTWSLLVRVNLGRSGSHVEIAESEVERRVQAALVVFGQMVEALSKVESTDEITAFAQKTVEKTLQDLVDWASERKSVAGLRKIIGAAQSLNLIESDAIASAKQQANSL
jgi:hypothetical protein